MMLRKIVCLLFILILYAKHSLAASCTLMTTVPVNFGTYNPLAEISDDTTGSLNISCVGVAGSYQLSFSPGRSNDFLSRKMYSNAYALNYNLYTNPARTLIWGDGTRGTSTVTGSANCSLTNACQHVVYGRIPASQGQAAVGNYSDTIIVTLAY
jgi:spore coat protein U-like protein